MVSNEKKNEITIENKFDWVNCMSSETNKFLKPKIEIAPKIGIDNKNDILAESTRLNCKNLAAVIAIPDLLTPGTRDKIWKRPIKKIDL